MSKKEEDKELEELKKWMQDSKFDSPGGDVAGGGNYKLAAVQNFHRSSKLKELTGSDGGVGKLAEENNLKSSDKARKITGIDAKAPNAPQSQSSKKESRLWQALKKLNIGRFIRRAKSEGSEIQASSTPNMSQKGPGQNKSSGKG